MIVTFFRIEIFSFVSLDVCWSEKIGHALRGVVTHGIGIDFRFGCPDDDLVAEIGILGILKIITIFRRDGVVSCDNTSSASVCTDFIPHLVYEVIGGEYGAGVYHAHIIGQGGYLWCCVIM